MWYNNRPHDKTVCVVFFNSNIQLLYQSVELPSNPLEFAMTGAGRQWWKGGICLSVVNAKITMATYSDALTLCESEWSPSCLKNL